MGFEFKSCIVQIKDKDTLVDSMLLNKLDYDVILRMDWLSTCYTSMDRKIKLVRIDFPGEPSFCIYGDCNIALISMVPDIVARKMLRQGGQGYLAVVDIMIYVGKFVLKMFSLFPFSISTHIVYITHSSVSLIFFKSIDWLIHFPFEEATFVIFGK